MYTHKIYQIPTETVFEWLKINLPTLTKQIISIMGDCLENSADIINNPICGRNETKLYTHVK